MLSNGSKKFGNENIWKQILKEADEDGDGFITFPEFTKMMNQFLRASEMIDRLTLQAALRGPPTKKKADTQNKGETKEDSDDNDSL